MAYSVPDLPYDYGALEPHIDEQTMRVHHDKHHQAYVDKANAALEGTEWADTDVDDVLRNLSSLPDDIQTPVRNNAGGHSNHTFFWQIMSPDGGGEPEGDLRAAIDDAFGGFDAFKDELKNAGVNRFGSGWAWLVRDGSGLAVVSTANQDSPISDGQTPLLGVDVWEHAYYLKYQNRRPDYIDAWWNVVNWAEVAGASGAIGRPLVRQLVAAGHEVTGMTSKPENAAAIEAAGATPVVCDALDAEAVKAAVAEDSAPEVVISQLTRLPRDYNPRKIDYGPTNRARAEGGHNLIEAAREAGARRFITQSIAFIYAPEGEMVKDEEARPWTDAPEPFRSGAELDARARARGDADAGARGPGAALRPVLRAGHLLRGRRQHRRAGAPPPLPDRGPRRGACSRSSTSTTPPRRPSPRWSAGAPGDLQRRRRRAGAVARVAARLRGGARRKAAAPGADVPGSAGGGAVRGGLRDPAPRRLERQGQARARLGAALSELAPGVSRGARIGCRSPSGLVSGSPAS